MKRLLLLAVAATGLLSSASAHAGYIGGPDTTTCREFTSTITVGNRLQEGVGTACLQGDGSWAIISGPGTGTSFFDNGIPVTYPANNYPVNNVYYSQPPQVQYVIQRERVYVPSSTVIISNGNSWRHPHHHGYPLRYGYRDTRHHDFHDHHRGRGHGHGYRY